ncbi:MAG: CHAP domain-containing protein [Chloroflexi bacterium]|nr:CHAP domain-containing protein [Chloroflexota bacterium]
MSFMDQRQNSHGIEQKSDIIHQYSPLPEQIPFPDNPHAENFPLTAHSHATTTAPVAASTQSATAILSTGNAPNITRQLTESPPTGTLSPTDTFPPLTTTPLRQQVVIRGSQKSKGTLRPPKGRRKVINVAAIVVLALILLTTLSVVFPVDSAGRGRFGIFQPVVSFVKSNNSNIGLVPEQAATATAVTQDGYDPGGGRTYAGIPIGPDSPGSTLSRFFYGQCTYWANYRYHQLTGHWVAWLGNADEWVYGAQSYGWTVSTSPKAGSIIVLMPGVQGAGPYGHVAIVESVNANGSVTTSNFNWQGNWAVETLVQFTPGPGVYFVSYPR